jgi:phosphoribosylformylglycinamidine synthase
MRARIVVRLRPGILDPQGTTIQRALDGLGFPEVRDLRVGKVLDLTLDETDAGRARQPSSCVGVGRVVESVRAVRREV